jgi:hypothetical protein
VRYTDMSQGDLLEYLEAKKLKHEGMAQVDENAAPAWKDAMRPCIEETAKQHRLFTADHVWDLAETRGISETTHDKRAFGPLMLWAAKAGICRKTNGPQIPSKRRTLHASPIQVWESLVYEGAE